MKGKFLYFELITAATAIIGVYNCSNNNTPLTILNMVVLLLYSLVCYFVAATRRNVSNTKEVINAYAHQLSWFGMSIMAVGNLFQIQYYPGKGTMMMIGLVTGVATLLYHLFNINKDNEIPSAVPPSNPEKNNTLVDAYQSKANTKKNTILNKFFGDMKYTHKELVIRLTIALAITAVSYYLHLQEILKANV